MNRWRRSHSRRWLGLRSGIAAFCAFGLSLSPALAARYGAVEVIVEPQPDVEGGAPEIRPGGYIEHRVTVCNHSNTADHQVRLIQPADVIDYPGDHLARNSRTIQVARGSTLVVSLLQPSLAVFDEHMAVEIDGYRQKELVDLPTPIGRGFGWRYYSSHSGQSLAVFASRGIPQDFKDNVRAAHPELVFCRSEVAATQWSANWMGYTGYDVVLLTEEEAASLPAEVLLALRRYVEGGGILLVQGASGDLDKLIPAALRDPDVLADSRGAFHVGFGLVRAYPASTPWPAEFWTARSKEPIAPRDRDVQVVGDISVPVRGLLAVVIVFAVGIGPVNVWLLSRKQKRMWLWWNVPAVSLATCLTVFVYSLFSEGVSGRGRTALITLLDENTRRATTLGYASYYCPLTPSDGPRFSYDTEVAQLSWSYAVRLDPFSGGGRAKTVDWTHDQHLDSGWVVARVPACFAIRKSETRRERLAMHRAADGSVTVVNGLGVDVDSLVYMDENGVMGSAADVPAGAERLLKFGESGDETPPDDPDLLRALFNHPWDMSLRRLRDSPQQYVARGCYVALVKKSPFLEDPLAAAPQEGSIGVIYGIGARSGDGR